jgi:hypothetical protein
MYALGIFLIHVGGFTVKGQTNFDLFDPATQLGSGISGSIGGIATYEVTIPSSSYAVSAADVGRILALRSQFNPLANSGLFRVTGIDSTNNGLVIDYRSAASPPVEQFLSWRIFENELTASQLWRSGSNATLNYASWNAGSSSFSNASRVVLRSPDQSSWQVRMCLESQADISGAVPSGFSIAPGFGGSGGGDFYPLDASAGTSVGQRLFLHGALWYNTTSSLYRGMTVGLSPYYGATGQWRISMMVDDVSGTCGIVNQNSSLPTYPVSGSGWCVFGLTDDETEIPAAENAGSPLANINRLFVAGSSNPRSNLTWTSQFHTDNNMQVVGWSKLGYPTPGVLSLYSDIINPGNTHVRYLTSSADTPWVGATELLDAEVLLGTVDLTLVVNSSSSLYAFLPRRVGRLPLFMQGRANYANWTVTGDGGWYHTQDGVFMQWGGPVPSGNPVTSSAYPILTKNEQQEGLDPLGAFLPGSDPPVPPVVPNVADIDATRFRKTYSYFRQVPVNVGVVKGGSNPAKP